MDSTATLCGRDSLDAVAAGLGPELGVMALDLYDSLRWESVLSTLGGQELLVGPGEVVPEEAGVLSALCRADFDDGLHRTL